MTTRTPLVNTIGIFYTRDGRRWALVAVDGGYERHCLTPPPWRDTRHFKLQWRKGTSVIGFGPDGRPRPSRYGDPNPWMENAVTNLEDWDLYSDDRYSDAVAAGHPVARHDGGKR